MLVQSAFRIGETICFTRRMSYTRAKLLGLNVNHRVIDKREIVFDIDAPNRQICHYVKELVSTNLRKECLSHKIYNTGNIGMHIHLTIPELGDYDYDKRKQARRLFLTHFAGARACYIDMLKVSDKVLIRMENSKHESTGRLKKMVDEYSFDVENCLPNWLKARLESYHVCEWVQPSKSDMTVIGNTLLSWCATNHIPAGNRNALLFKNIAALIFNMGIESVPKQLIDKIHLNTGERRQDIFGWIDYFKHKGIANYNGQEVLRWFKEHQLTI